MRILITNDDGIAGPGLAVLEDIAMELAGPDGEVWIVAPATEMSGVGHCISYAHPVLFQKRGPRRFAVEGYPADCVLAGLQHLIDGPVDLVLSGVNKGNNAAENTVYSGTIGATMEAALAGIPAVALSQFFGPKSNKDDYFGPAAAFGASAVRACQKAGFDRQNGYMTFYNVNFPPVPRADVLGMKAVSQGYRGDQPFQATPVTGPNRRDYLFLHGKDQQTPTDPGTDAHANLNGWVSITPMRADLTAMDAMNTLGAVLADQ